MGYSPFDHYDLGDKYQKGFLKTKMGDKDQLLRMVAVLRLMVLMLFRTLF